MHLSPQWYKDAIIYQLHVKAFHDANGDGIGDFEGLRQKLPYLQDLGITAIWMLPFYPSPQRDDGYDIADYYNVHPNYGTLDDFRRLLNEAHERGIFIITELVINHTSDQHKWFQWARRAPAGSAERNMYVWSDTPEKYEDARIIFQDFEPSNWSWDPLAKAYYWHRFYHHQPDLNFENPAVQDAIFEMLDFWLSMGVDGLRLDAIPYLYEEEGTNCENLPQTHAFLKKLRKHVDDHYPNRMLLAEANQWPEDAVEYFGDGDECHMSFHFPIMPRLYMSLFMEDRFPIIDILEQTPDIPENAQWAMFLRNHDELTLEMVTDEERDYMYEVYAKDPRARINLGIRRRLAPLLNNDRRKIELLNFLLFSLPGTPVIYYGDEIGMGDNFYLGDRDGVRTPMQWNQNKNAGFSEANPQALYLPLILDPVYYYESVNVENQLRNESSLLWWMKKMLAVREQFAAFGRGRIAFLLPENPKILAFVRALDDEQILVIINLSRFSQVVELELATYEGCVPVDVFSGNAFPAIGREPYRFTMGGYNYFWFELTPTDRMAGRHPELAELSAAPDLEAGISKGLKHELEKQVLPTYLGSKHWFNRSGSQVRKVEILDQLSLPYDGHTFLLLFLQATYTEDKSERNLLSLAIAEELTDENREGALARFAVAHRHYWLMDALYVKAYSRALTLAFHEGNMLKGNLGTLTFRGAIADDVLDKEGIYRQQDRSKAVLNYDKELVLKLYYQVRHHQHPDLEMLNWLNECGQPVNVPRVLGSITYFKDGQEHTVGLALGHVQNRGTAAYHVMDQVLQVFEHLKVHRHDEGRQEDIAQLTTEALGVHFPEQIKSLGETVGEIHAAVGGGNLPEPLRPEAFSLHYQRSVYQTLRSRVRRTLNKMKKDLPASGVEAAYLKDNEERILALLEKITKEKMDIRKIRVHGDMRLERFLFTGSTFFLTDYEGYVERSIGERRIKSSAMQDIAALFFSWHEAIFKVLYFRKMYRGEEIEYLQQCIGLIKRHMADRFWEGYCSRINGAKLVPAPQQQSKALLNAYLIGQAFQFLGQPRETYEATLKIAGALVKELLDDL